MSITSTAPLGALIGLATLAVAGPTEADTITLNVGAGGQYLKIGDAVAAANRDMDPSHYYDVWLAPGTYTNDFAEIDRPMTIEVDPQQRGKPVVLKATVPLPNQKGILLALASLTIDGLTFTGAAIDNSLGGNGAGIRDQIAGNSASLIVRNSVFDSNQEGILTGDNQDETITVTNSKFINNGNPDIHYFQHALYVNYAGSLTVTDSVFCGQLIGHNVKSRAKVTTVANNQIHDGQDLSAIGCRAGSSSLAVDIPEGGVATISGNQLVQGPASPNYKIVDYGEEGLAYGTNSVLVSNNDFRNSAPGATGIYDPTCVTIKLVNNSFEGIRTVVDPPGCAEFE